jgi:hypothetical protein
MTAVSATGGEMNDAEPDSDATAKTIEHTFGDRWGIWLSTTGHWWAALRNTLTAADLNAGCVPFLRASNPDELTHAVHQQEELHASATASPADRAAGSPPDVGPCREP